ncbi:helix-turn-helix transcriptional regulator [Catenulispora sp. NL8]|uniref:Helix-turn-helix transcriptional regulator n=1 Tax=Catenulispora pinistramenti TaxID=2705254 RepID=A0ABS5L4Y7_9ACTN|nr:helix-turn-helix domain-containing protein [Catenulispora pinistramenti]MBS2553418.1 helix-turn-helix transcriptional regulator [Catenulispora pinistramenti]
MYLPADVRDRPDVMRACADRDLGRFFNLIKNLTDGPAQFTASHIGRRCGLTPSRVADYIMGKHGRVSVEVIERVADGLRVPGAYFGLGPRPWEASGQHDAPSSQPARMPGIQQGDQPPQSHLAAMDAFRVQDRRIGGGHFYRAVADYLGQHIGPQLAIGGDLAIFSAAAGLNEMAGWMAHDAGRDPLAERHFKHALALSQTAKKPEHSAGIYASMSHLALQAGDAHRAVELARTGQQTARRGLPQPVLTARLFAMEARGLAELGDRHATAQGLASADKALGLTSSGEVSEWLSPFDEASLAIEVAHCMRKIGQRAAALRTAERAVALRDAERARSRAFGLILTAQLLVENRDPEGACAVGRAVIGNTVAPGSARVITLLDDLRTALVPYQSSRVVSDFLTLLSREQQSRRWLMAGLAVPDDEGRMPNHADPRGHDAG